MGSNTIYNYGSHNRLLSTVSTGGAYTRYSYDNNGNMLSKASGIMEPIKKDELTIGDLPDFGLIIRRGHETGTGSDYITLYSYDHYHRLTKTESKDTEASYLYNAQGYRVKKTVNGKTMKYLYEVDKVVLETDGSNKQLAFQVYGSSLLYRKVAKSTSMEEQSYYYLYNAHGDVTALIDAEGNIAATYDYDAFGTIITETGNADNYIKYAGYQHDDESGLYYLNARYYDSTIARFITEDSYRGQRNDPLSLNLYTYCDNNPVIYFDPTGHWKQSDENLYPAIQDEIRGLTKAYHAATTKEVKARIHARAESLRSNKNNYVVKQDIKQEPTPVINPTKNTDSVDKGTDNDSIISNLMNYDGFGDKKDAMIKAAEALLCKGYEPAFIAGLLANINYEGSPGVFEKSNYGTFMLRSNRKVNGRYIDYEDIRNYNKKGAYLIYMDKFTNYSTCFSGNTISDVGLDAVNTLFDQMTAIGEKTVIKGVWNEDGEFLGYYDKKHLEALESE